MISRHREAELQSIHMCSSSILNEDDPRRSTDMTWKATFLPGQCVGTAFSATLLIPSSFSGFTTLNTICVDHNYLHDFLRRKGCGGKMHDRPFFMKVPSLCIGFKVLLGLKQQLPLTLCERFITNEPEQKWAKFSNQYSGSCRRSTFLSCDVM